MRVIRSSLLPFSFSHICTALGEIGWPVLNTGYGRGTAVVGSLTRRLSYGMMLYLVCTILQDITLVLEIKTYYCISSKQPD